MKIFAQVIEILFHFSVDSFIR